MFILNLQFICISHIKLIFNAAKDFDIPNPPRLPSPQEHQSSTWPQVANSQQQDQQTNPGDASGPQLGRQHLGTHPSVLRLALESPSMGHLPRGLPPLPLELRSKSRTGAGVKEEPGLIIQAYIEKLLNSRTRTGPSIQEHIQRP